MESCRSVKACFYDLGITYTDIASELGVAPRNVTYVVTTWEGKIGNPKGKTRKVLKVIEEHIGRSIADLPYNLNPLSVSVIGNASLKVTGKPQFGVDTPEVESHQDGEEPGG